MCRVEARDGAGTSSAASHDGRVDDSDDAYAPYWPGARYVDWVGLSMYDYGLRQRFGANVVAAPGRFLAELHGRYGYAVPRGAGRDFVAEYARHRPMLIETAALYDPGNTGAKELTVKQSWWRQVFAPDVRRVVPTLQMIAWLERRRREAEVGNTTVDWRATHTPALARAFLRTLKTDGVDVRPLLIPKTRGHRNPSPAFATSAAGRPPAPAPRPGPSSGITLTVIGATAAVAISIALDQRRRRIRHRGQR